MRTIIYWFSGTGNSFHVAKSLQENLDDVELIPVASALNGDIEIAPATGLVFPVYAFGPPVMVSKFIERLPSTKPDYLFAVVTYGGAPGSTIALTRRMLKNRGLLLNAGFSVKMVENYPPFGGAPEEQEQQKVNGAAETGIKEIITSVRECTCGDLSKKNLLMSLMGHLIYPMFKVGLSIQKKSKFYADDKCTSCGICQKVCPVQNVQLTDGVRPTWGNRCEQCFACFHWCPEQAIQYGRKTLNQVRYHHPDTKLNDMMLN